MSCPHHKSVVAFSTAPLLAIESTTTLVSCAVRVGEDCISRDCPTSTQASETLLPLIRELIALSGVPLSRFLGIAFGNGPGAFTGLRLAAAVAQGLAVGADLPVLPVGSLDILAADVLPNAQKPLFAFLDARMGEVYFAHYLWQAGALAAWQRTGDILLQSPEKMLLPLDVGMVCGNAMPAYPLFEKRLTAAGFIVNPPSVPKASTLSRLALPRFLAGDGVDPALAVPHYVRDKVAKTIVERLAEGRDA